MSQDSLILPTTGTLSGLSLVQDLNAALANLSSCASGSTDPSTLPGGVQPYSLWLDTSVTPPVLRQRNSANSDWGGIPVALGTQPQHTTQLAQVQSMLLGASGHTTISLATTLTAASAGKHHVFSAGVPATLPAAASLSAGQAISFQSLFAGASVVRAGTDVITTGNGTPTSITLNAGDTLTLMSDGTTGWYVVDGSMQLQFAAIMRQATSLATTGYRLFPAYPGDPAPLILQWGATGNISVNTSLTITLPIAFPNSFFSFTPTPQNTSAAYCSGVRNSNAQASIYMWAGTGSAHWMAVGN